MCVVRMRVVRAHVVVVASVQLPAAELPLSTSLMVLLPSVPLAAAAASVFCLTFRGETVTVPLPSLSVCCVAAEETIRMPGEGKEAEEEEDAPGFVAAVAIQEEPEGRKDC